MTGPIPPQATGALPGGPGSLAVLRSQATQLEGVFLNTLMKEMFSSIPTDGTFGGGFGEETWRSMQAEQLAGAVASAGGIGLADQIVSNLLSVQQAAQSLPEK